MSNTTKDVQITGTLRLIRQVPTMYRFGYELPKSRRSHAAKNFVNVVSSCEGSLYVSSTASPQPHDDPSYFYVISGPAALHSIQVANSKVFYIDDLATALMVAHDLVCIHRLRQGINVGVQAPEWFCDAVQALQLLSGHVPLNYNRPADNSYKEFEDFPTLFEV